MIVLIESIYQIEAIVLVISIITGICYVFNVTISKNNRHMNSYSTSTLKKSIIALASKYEDCLSDQHRLFDEELTQLLLIADQRGEEMTIDICNIILRTLINMARHSEAKLHFKSMINNNMQLTQLSFALMVQSILSLIESTTLQANSTSDSNANDNYDLLAYCLSQFDKLNAEQKNFFNGSNDQYVSLVKAYCHYDNYSNSVLYYKKISCECKSRRACINDLIFVLYNNKQFALIIDLLTNQYSFEEKDNRLLLDYYIKALIKAKTSIELIEKVYFAYQINISQETSDLVLEHIAKKASSEQKALRFFSSLQNHTIVSYGIMMSLYAQRKDAESTKYYFAHLLSTGIQPSIIHCHLMLKCLIQTNQITPAIELFDRMSSEWKMQHDKLTFELLLKACIDNKRELKGYEIIMQSINENIKLEKFYYEEIIEAINSSEIKNKSSLMHSLSEVIQISNFRRDKVLMKKLKIIMEKDISVSSTDTMASCFEKVK